MLKRKKLIRNNDIMKIIRMPIKHIVLAGGGYLGLYHLGILSQLLNVGYLKRSNIKTIHGTSIGAFFGAVFCLNDEWTTTLDYFINRPWQKVFNITPNMVFNALSNKGLYGRETFVQLIEIAFYIWLIFPKAQKED